MDFTECLRIILCSCIGGKYMYKESDLAKILIQKER